ncbi:hypothetical protein ACFX16_020238 [Malus domestica]
MYPWRLEKVQGVYCENWYGPFRDGDQLSECAIRDSAFCFYSCIGSFRSPQNLARSQCSCQFLWYSN